MTLTIELTPELEASLQHAAEREGVDAKAFVVSTLQERLAHASPVESLSRREAELLAEINVGIAPAMWDRYGELQSKRRAETLTPEEQTELVSMAHQIELANARRLERLIALAQLRGTTLASLMRDLGLKPPENA